MMRPRWPVIALIGSVVVVGVLAVLAARRDSLPPRLWFRSGGLRGGTGTAAREPGLAEEFSVERYSDDEWHVRPGLSPPPEWLRRLSPEPGRYRMSLLWLRIDGTGWSELLLEDAAGSPEGSEEIAGVWSHTDGDGHTVRLTLHRDGTVGGWPAKGRWTRWSRQLAAAPVVSAAKGPYADTTRAFRAELSEHRSEYAGVDWQGRAVRGRRVD